MSLSVPKRDKLNNKKPESPHTELPGSQFSLIYNMRLPATVAAATSTSIAAISATTASAASATTAASPTAPTTAEPSTSAPCTTAASALAGWPSFVHNDITSHEIVAVESLNGALGFLVDIDLDKPEPARLPRKTVAHQGNIRRSDSRLSK